MKLKRVLAAASIAALGLTAAGCGDDDDDDDIIDDITDETVTDDLDPGAGSGLPGDEDDEGTTG